MKTLIKILIGLALAVAAGLAILRLFAISRWPFAKINAPKTKLLVYVMLQKINPKAIKKPLIGEALNPQQAKEFIHNTVNLQVIDLRDPISYQRWRITKDAINLFVQDPNFLVELNKLPKNKIYLLYDQKGEYAEQVAQVMKYLGFRKVYWLSWGVVARSKAWEPVVKFEE